MLRLVEMSDEEYRVAMDRMIARYAEMSVRRGEWTQEEALGASREALEGYRPQGRNTPGHFFMKVQLEATGEQVGECWYIANMQGGKLRFWLDWIWIDPAHRRRGYATEALELLAAEARRRGADHMGLFVFTDNPEAVRLYEKLGFVTRAMSMARDLSPGR